MNVKFFYSKPQLPSNAVASALSCLIYINVIKMLTSAHEVIGEVAVAVLPYCVHVAFRLHLELIAVGKWRDFFAFPNAEVVQHATHHGDSQLLFKF